MSDRTTNLLISSNVHYAHLGGDNKETESLTFTETQNAKNKLNLKL